MTSTKDPMPDATPDAVRTQDTPLWLVVLWLAFISGGARTASLLVAHTMLHQVVRAGPDICWRAPLGLFLILAALAIPLTIIRQVVKPLRFGAWQIAVLGSVTGFDFALNIPGIHLLSAAILGIGLGVQLARVSTRDPALARRWGLRTLIPVAVVTLVVSGGVILLPILEERRRFTALPVPGPGQPNVLLIVLDTQRAMSMSVHGYGAPTTPILERLAASGVRFNQAYSTAPWTLPSHGSIMTGRQVHELSTDWARPLDDTYPTLAEELHQLGYATAGFTANELNTAFESGLARGFGHYEDRPRSLAGIVSGTQIGRRLAASTTVMAMFGRHFEFGRKTASDVTAESLRWLDRHPDRPYFVFLNYFDAHDPYPAPPPFDSIFDLPASHERLDLAQTGWTGWSPERVAIQRKAYEASIAYVDHELGLLFDALRIRSRFDNTLVIVTSDHGEEFYEHGLMRHASSLYGPSLHVPLILRYPQRLPSGTTVTTPVSLRDLPATIMDVLDANGRSPFPGRSLLQHLSGTPASIDPILAWLDDNDFEAPEWTPVHNGPLKSVLIGRHRYIVDANGKEELYALDDPLEQHNLVTDPAFADSLAGYRRIAAGMVRTQPPAAR